MPIPAIIAKKRPYASKCALTIANNGLRELLRLDFGKELVYTRVVMSLREQIAKLLPRRTPNGRLMGLRELSQETGVSYVALRAAALNDRMWAHKSGGVWLSNVAAVERAIEAGRLRRK